MCRDWRVNIWNHITYARLIINGNKHYVEGMHNNTTVALYATETPRRHAWVVDAEAAAAQEKFSNAWVLPSLGDELRRNDLLTVNAIASLSLYYRHHWTLWFTRTFICLLQPISIMNVANRNTHSLWYCKEHNEQFWLTCLFWITSENVSNLIESHSSVQPIEHGNLPPLSHNCCTD